MGNSWEYYVSTNERDARLKPGTANGARFSEEEAQFFVYDHLGNTRITYTPVSLSSEYTQNRIDYVADYFPYGKVLREFVYDKQERYLTTQHERDQETGLDYRGARYYDSDLGRFLSVDPLAVEYMGWSTYNYVLGNPNMFIDPTGKVAEDWVKNKVTNQVEFKEEATSQETTPEGYEYLFKDGYGLGEDGPIHYKKDGTSEQIDPELNVVLSKKTAPASKTPWIDVAMKEVGVTEKPDPNENPKIVEYLRSAGNNSGSDETPWCASFVHWSLAQTGIKGAGPRGRDYKNWGTEMQTPVPGAVAIFKTGHVGFYIGTMKNGNYIILHGNWGNKVELSNYIKPSEIEMFRFPIIPSTL